MALSQKKLQQKKAKKKQKRVQQIQTQKKANVVSIHQSPIEHSLVHSDIWKAGIGTVLIVRRANDGRLFMGNYLIDTWCLGVKDAFVREVSFAQLDDFLSKHSMDKHTPAYCKALIMSSIEYGKQNNFKPNLDDKSKKFIAAIQYDPSSYQFEFGKEGEAFYISGPHDDELLPNMIEKSE
ncbi:hypothetical protein H0A36_27060 [Endozoicomonas sp. SM1973]|uniref:Uncharacterized protein n=1 Tax=Spartinivicinus marinus TaxID=2994442 RepID=A0A853I9U9_9GAMM|nr:hypothetical protein [Spartinivicinus marinus]NYZ69679.1 hypothetical protein [Spartinivicinus marinus]